MSGRSAIKGKMIRPTQKSMERYNIPCIPAISAAKRKVGQKLAYSVKKKNHDAIEPQMARCVKTVQALVSNPAFRQTVTTTYCNERIMGWFVWSWLHNWGIPRNKDEDIPYKPCFQPWGSLHLVHCPKQHLVSWLQQASNRGWWNAWVHSPPRTRTLSH